MKKTFLVAYDIANPARLRRVHKLVRGYGRRLQYSIYRCPLTAKQRVLLQGKLADLINANEDRVMFICLGPSGATTVDLETIGAPLPEEPPNDLVL